VLRPTKASFVYTLARRGYWADSDTPPSVVLIARTAYPLYASVRWWAEPIN
jgi:hypothetical protein